MECWKWVVKEVYQWEDKRRTSKWVCVLRQHNICKWLAERNRKVLSQSSEGLNFFRADIRCERVFLKKLAFLWCYRARCWGRYKYVHWEDVSSISITGSLLFPSDGPMFQSEMDLEKHLLQILAVVAWPEQLPIYVICLKIVDTVGVLHFCKHFLHFIRLHMPAGHGVLRQDTCRWYMSCALKLQQESTHSQIPSQRGCQLKSCPFSSGVS